MAMEMGTAMKPSRVSKSDVDPNLQGTSLNKDSPPRPNLKEIRERAEAATAGPWSWRLMGGTLMLVTDHSGAQVVLLCNGRTFHTRDHKTGTLVPLRPSDAVAESISHARTDIPLLLDYIGPLLSERGESTE